MVYYFAYGSNMSLKQMKERCGDIWKRVGIGYVDGYELVFDGYSYTWKGATANMVKNPEEKVWGVVYEFNSLDELKNCLDKYEGYPSIYDRCEFEVFILEKNTKVKAIAYVRPKPLVRGKPSKEYLERIIEGAKENGLPQDWIGRLKGFLKSFLPKSLL